MFKLLLLILGVTESFDQENPRTMPPEAFSVRVGSTNHAEGGEVYKISAVYCRYAGSSNDIAMLKTAKRMSLNGSNKKAIRLPTSSSYYPEENTNAYIQGWG